MQVLISLARLQEAMGGYEGYCLECCEFTRDSTEPDATGYDCPVCEENKVVGAENLMFTAGIRITEEEETGGGILAGASLGAAITTAMMGGTLDTETGARLHEIHETVCRDIFCGGCGHILDTHKSVLVEATIDRGDTGIPTPLILDTMGSFVRCGTCWDKQGPGLKAAYKSATFAATDFRDYGPDLQLKQKAPPVKAPKAPKVANVRLRSGENCTVAYSRRFTEHGLTFFIHGEQGEWEVSCWDTGMRLNTFKTQKAGIERVQGLNEKELRDIRGAISLHGGLNPSVKGGKS